MTRAARRLMFSLGGLLWLATVGVGFALVTNYSTTPGESAAPGAWPAGTGLALAPDQPTLVLFVHPQCPCSRACLGELARLLATCRGRVAVQVAFLKPAGFDDAWVRSDLWRSAAALPGVAVVCDEEGREAQRFGATTSGQALLFAPTGELRFRGGITAARGHAGDNTGSDALAALILGGADEQATTPVFGCALGDAAGARPGENLP